MQANPGEFHAYLLQNVAETLTLLISLWIFCRPNIILQLLFPYNWITVFGFFSNL